MLSGGFQCTSVLTGVPDYSLNPPCASTFCRRAMASSEEVKHEAGVLRCSLWNSAEDFTFVHSEHATPTRETLGGDQLDDARMRRRAGRRP